MSLFRIFSFFIIFSTLLCLGQGCKYSATKETRQVFHYNEPTGIASLDPAFAKNQSIMWATHQLYSTLVEADSNLKMKPLLAKSWTFSADRKTIRFLLRNDVFFHDHDAFPQGKGRLMTASDVVFSFQRLIDPATASPGAWIFNGRVDSLQPFTAVNDTIFELRLQKPFSPIIGVLSNQYCSIVAPEAVKKYGKDFRRHPCGTGPFQFHSWDEGTSLVFWKNPHYFERDAFQKPLPYLDAVQVYFYDHKSTEFLMFQQGEIDFMNDIDPSFKDELLSKKGILRDAWKNKVQLKKHPYLNTEYLGILMDSHAVKNNPLRSVLIRRAINYGFDKQKMMLYLRNSIGRAAESGFIPAGLPSFDAKKVPGYSYDPEKAKQLLKSSGYDAATSEPIKLLTIPTYADLANYIARELEDIGLKVQVEAIPKGLLLEQTATQKAPFFRASWIADYPEAENYLSVFYGKNPAPPNYTRYHNDAFDHLFDLAMETENDSLRYAYYQAMDRMIIQDAPIVPLWYDEVIHLIQPWMQGFEPNGLNMLELRRARKGDDLKIS